MAPIFAIDLCRISDRDLGVVHVKRFGQSLARRPGDGGGGVAGGGAGGDDGKRGDEVFKSTGFLSPSVFIYVIIFLIFTYTDTKQHKKKIIVYVLW